MKKCIHHDQCGEIEFINDNAIQYNCDETSYLLMNEDNVERLCESNRACQDTFGMADVRCAAITSDDLPDLKMTKCVMSNKCGRQIRMENYYADVTCWD